MLIERLQFSGFRNLAACRLEVGAAPVVALVGANGAGKTSVLEALSLLSPGTGLLKAKLDQQVQDDAPQWALHAEVTSGTTPHKVGLAYTKGGQRQLKIDEEEAVKQTDLSQLGSVVWWTPRYDRLFLDAAKPRRDFLDRLVFALIPEHAESCSRYRHHLRNRQRLLKDGIGGDWLALEEQRIADYAAQILKQREDYLSKFFNYCDEVNLSMTGSAQAALDAEDVAVRVANQLSLNRERDGQYGDTHFGPHRSDVTGSLKLLDEPAVPLHRASSGQHKRALLAIIMAHSRLLHDHTGQPPLILLDEVLAHLDEKICHKVLMELAELGAQVWLAGTEVGPFASANPLVVNVASGTLTPQPRLVAATG